MSQVRTLRMGGYYMEVYDWLCWWEGKGVERLPAKCQTADMTSHHLLFWGFFCQVTHFKNKTHAGTD